jgi:hypothetical protein
MIAGFIHYLDIKYGISEMMAATAVMMLIWVIDSELA